MVGEPAVWPDPDPGWRVRMGAGLLAHTPMSDERREAFRREEERERLQAERDAEMREQARVERVGELLMQGHTPKTQAELFQQVSFAQDRQDRRDRQLRAGPPSWRANRGRRMLPCCARPESNVRHVKPRRRRRRSPRLSSVELSPS